MVDLGGCFKMSYVKARKFSGFYINRISNGNPSNLDSWLVWQAAILNWVKDLCFAELYFSKYI